MRHLTRLLLPAVVFVLTLGGVTAPVQAGKDQGDGRPVAANNTARPFKGSASGGVEFVEDDACASGLRAEYAVPGRASHLGQVQVIGSHCASDDPTLIIALADGRPLDDLDLPPNLLKFF